MNARDLSDPGRFLFLEVHMKIGIVGARKYKDKLAVINLVNSISVDNQIITSGCRGVCIWVKEAAEKRGIKVIVFEPDLSNIRANFEIPKRYYARNKQMIKMCEVLHAFISAEDGYTGGTKIEIEYAIKRGIPIRIHWENGVSKWIYKQILPFKGECESFLLSWQDFFIKTDLGYRGVIS